MKKKLGIIDSGIGGLSILKDLMDQALTLEYFYISDEKNVPYGGKTQEFMLERMSIMSQKLIDKNVDAIFIACNTATAQTIENLRKKFPVPFIGIEPYINHINLHQDNSKNKYALILTPATYKSARFQNLLSKLDPQKNIDLFPLKNLAMILESLKYKTFDEIKNEIDNEIDVLKNRKYTHLILGCTHYPLITNYLEGELNLTTINPSEKVINVIKKLIDISKNNSTNHTFYYNFSCTDLFKKTNLQDLKFLYLN